MPQKRDQYSSHGQKLISLFARLLFSRESHSLIELAMMLHCSKQTVMRNVEDIRRAYGVDIEEWIEGRKKYYRISKIPSRNLAVGLTENEVNALFMCRAFTEQLLGNEMYEEATRAVEKSLVLYPRDKGTARHHFGTFKPGSIDYTPHRESIQNLITAMDLKKICRISYKAILSDKTKTFYISPIKIFSRHDTMYVHAKLARAPKEKYLAPDFDPLLAVHRIKKVELTERSFTYPESFDFEKSYNKTFGIIREKSFKAEVEFIGYAAKYVAERMWSPDQKITQKGKGGIVLSFTASSRAELVSWILSWREEAKLLKPAKLVEEIQAAIEKMGEVYSSENLTGSS